MRPSLEHLIVVAVLSFSACSRTDAPQRHVSVSTPGEILFKERCRDCHKVRKHGGDTGPDLTPDGGKPRSRSFVAHVISEPSSVFPGTVMPPHRDLSGKQIESLVDYLVDLK